MAGKARGTPKAKKPRLKTNVCKPCWELKYCPYGPLVEFFPLHPEDQSLTQIRRLHREVKRGFKEGRNRTTREIASEVERFLYTEPTQWEYLAQFETAELACNVFGHVCPVFLSAEGATETKVGRSTSREIPRDVMLQVVRRDGQICQKCHTATRDNEVEFDHVIPFSKGGPTTAENLRLVHRSCNRKKGSSLESLLWQHDDPV